ncbi:MAG: DNA-binding protein, partial [Anaerolineae bacterium]|nr:DNA-binding protein [Anaerolineae bacterium]
PPRDVARAAARGLELRKKFKRGGTPVGIKRAVQLARRDPVSVRTLQRMVSFFARHAVDRRPGWGNPRNPTNGYIAWMIWGGDPGRRWAIHELARFKRMEAEAVGLASLLQRLR